MLWLLCMPIVVSPFYLNTSLTISRHQRLNYMCSIKMKYFYLRKKINEGFIVGYSFLLKGSKIVNRRLAEF